MSTMNFVDWILYFFILAAFMVLTSSFSEIIKFCI